jgi:hypothetical protein
MAATPPRTGPAPANPAELLQQQVNHLNSLVDLQRRQQGEIIQQIERLRSDQAQQADRLVRALEGPRAARLERGDHLLPLVAVTNFNMPFVSLVAFLVKFALASIPAALIIAAIWFVAVIVFGGSLGLFNTLLR